VDDDAWSPAPLVRPKSPERRDQGAVAPELYTVIRQIQADVDRKAAGPSR
jgi:hypothetical protein